MALLTTLLLAVASATGPLAVDGNPGEPFWTPVPAQALTPAEDGVPAALGGEVRVAWRGRDLVFAARCPEPGGKVLARSIGINPVWEKDASSSPEVEDRVELRLGRLTVGVNPWGAVRVEKDGAAASAAGVLAAARVTPSGWTLEAVIPPGLLDAGALRIERIRSRRPLAPEFRWSYETTLQPPPRFSSQPAPEFRPPQLGNAEPPVEVGRVDRLPPLVSEWDESSWRNVPAFPLSRDARYPTELRWVHDGRTLALLARLEEPEPVVARAGGRDSAVTGDDHFAIHLATSGSAFLEIAVNPAGAILDAKAVGPRIARPSAGWNAPIEVQTNIRHGAWVARINLPLRPLADALGESAIPAHWRVLLSRFRAPRPGETYERTTLPAVASPTFFGPLRYRRLTLTEQDPARVAPPTPPANARPRDGLAAQLARLDTRVWSPLERRFRAVRNVVDNHQRRRVEQAALAAHRDWEQVRTRDDWEREADDSLWALREAVAVDRGPRPPLDVRVTARRRGPDYQWENLVYQSRPGFYVAANLYLPASPAPRMPAIVIQHSHHYPRT